jgi:hypothetical protein
MAKKKCPDYIGAWIRNYLNERTFQVRVQSTKSINHKIKCGVPQGSVLGPLLFNIFIDDLTDQISTADKGLFADDLTIWTSSQNIETIEKNLQQALEEIGAWSSIWRLKVSNTKTVSTLFTRINGQGKRKLDLTLNKNKIKTENKPKLLGLIMDKNLTFHDHIKEINDRLQRRINMMRSIRGKSWGASSKLLLTTYKTLIRPIIEYVPFVKYSASNTSMMTLELLQRKAIKIALRLPISAPNQEAYKLARIDNISDRFETLSKRYLQKASESNQLIKELIGNYDPNKKPRIKKSVKPILNYLLPQTNQSTTASTSQPTTTSQLATNPQIRQQRTTTRRGDNWQNLINFVEQLNL